MRCVIACIPIFIAVGCGRPAGIVFPRIDPPILFPSPPEKARIAYVGQLRSDQDLRPAVSGWQVFTGALAGQQAALGVSAPAGIAVTDADRVFVTDPPQRCVHVFDLRSRTYRRLIAAGDEPLSAPADVAAAESHVYVSDAGRAAIDVFTDSGDYIRTWRIPSLKRPFGITYAASCRRLFVLDSARHECIGLSLDGLEQMRFGRRGAGPGEFNFPTYIAADANRGLLVSDSMNFRIQRFGFDGRFVSSFGRKGDAAGDFALPKGVAVDAAGRAYVVDAQFENVQVFDPGGRLLMAFGREGREPGRFWLPSKIVIDSRGRLWVTDSYNRRIQVFQFVGENAT